jgi:hypothetical protein
MWWIVASKHLPRREVGVVHHDIAVDHNAAMEGLAVVSMALLHTNHG